MDEGVLGEVVSSPSGSFCPSRLLPALSTGSWRMHPYPFIGLTRNGVPLRVAHAQVLRTALVSPRLTADFADYGLKCHLPQQSAGPILLTSAASSSGCGPPGGSGTWSTALGTTHCRTWVRRIVNEWLRLMRTELR
ncbi:hypothetical protein Vretimale_6025 [Volvox reticuliferus]|uniref:Uncharacterized protein n=1 Tax=Volvox reticuliferus TaxID=1737510 RepID=A0A8J4G6X6_9CHLO|nr:hypothetical protein Vretimale_6025 [Volvox reticuliferus]